MFLDFVTEVIHCGCRQVPAAGVLGCVAQAWATAMSPLSWGVSLGSCKIAGDLQCRKEETSKKSAGRLCWRVITMRSVSFYSCCSSSVLLWYAHSHLFHLWCSLGLIEARTQTCPQSSSMCCHCGRSNVKIGTYSESWCKYICQPVILCLTNGGNKGQLPTAEIAVILSAEVFP